MIRHVVMFKLKDMPQEEKLAAAQLIKKELEELPLLIKEISDYEVGINLFDTERSYDICLVSSFEDIEKLEIYRKHPAHIRVVDVINLYKKSVIAVDYEI